MEVEQVLRSLLDQKREKKELIEELKNEIRHIDNEIFRTILENEAFDLVVINQTKLNRLFGDFKPKKELEFDNTTGPIKE